MHPDLEEINVKKFTFYDQKIVAVSYLYAKKNKITDCILTQISRYFKSEIVAHDFKNCLPA